MITVSRRPAGLGDPATLLAVWEAVDGVSGHARGAAVAAAVAGDGASFEPLDLPLDDLARIVVDQYVAAFGPRVGGMLTCPACASVLDVDADLGALFPLPDQQQRGPAPHQQERVVGPGCLAVRSPTSADLVAAGLAQDPASELVRRCVRLPDGTPARLADLSPDDLIAMDDELERRAGSALPMLRTTCPQCEGRALALVDPVVLLWAALRSAATALIQDVADLAAAFGWREDDILKLPERRRAAYLDRVRP